MAQKSSEFGTETVVVTMQMHLQRILFITAAYYGIAPIQGVGSLAGGPQA